MLCGIDSRKFSWFKELTTSYMSGNPEINANLWYFVKFEQESWNRMGDIGEIMWYHFVAPNKCKTKYSCFCNICLKKCNAENYIWWKLDMNFLPLLKIFSYKCLSTIYCFNRTKVWINSLFYIYLYQTQTLSTHSFSF